MFVFGTSVDLQKEKVLLQCSLNFYITQALGDEWLAFIISFLIFNAWLGKQK
jgi:hypothetical protein